MSNHKKNIFIGFIVMFLLFVINISLGSVLIPLKDIWHVFFNANEDNVFKIIVLDFRLPKAFVAILVGFALSISGMMMQTFFRNPLAGPYVLGLSSGSSLGVALLVMGSSLLSFVSLNDWSISLVSIAGSSLVFLLIILVANRMKNIMAVLLVGMMFSSFASAIISVLSYFSTAESLQRFTFWAMGNLSNLNWKKIYYIILFTFIGLILCFSQLKTLNALLLGENYALSMGINIKKSKYIIIFSTAILTGIISAFVGPIAFVGLIVPHIVKMIFKTSQHHLMFWHCLWVGGSLMLVFDIISQLPGLSYTLPINAVTSLIGAPFVIWIIFKRSKHLY